MSENCSQPEFYRSHLGHDNERRTRYVVILTCITMVVEILGGQWLGSMALLADGFHMTTHAAALGISLFAYGYARRHAHDPQYSFGTGKVGDLAGFTSAILLIGIALFVVYESTGRLISPRPIAYGEASLIAVIGLLVNAASAWILRGKHPHTHHGHHHADHQPHGHHHNQHDSNFRSAYLHVLADAVTSVLAIAALLCGWWVGWSWLDPLVGMVGAVVILSWAWGLVRTTSAVLLDHMPHDHMGDDIRKILMAKDAHLKDMHLFRVGAGKQAVILSISVASPVTAAEVHEWLKPLELAHVTVEINA